MQESFFKPFNNRLVLETFSQKTYEHLVIGALASRKYIKKEDKIIIFCDNCRRQKVEVEAAVLYDKLFNFEVISFDRQDIHPRSDSHVQLTEGLPSDLNSESFHLCKKLLKAEFNL